jgi:hypothetical protein
MADRLRSGWNIEITSGIDDTESRRLTPQIQSGENDLRAIVKLLTARARCFWLESGFPEGWISDSNSVLEDGGQHG